MKLLTFEYNGKRSAGVLSEDGKNVIKINIEGKEYEDIGYMLSSLKDISIEKIRKYRLDSKDSIPLSDVKLCAPIPYPNQDVICLGINYMAHAEESARYKEQAFGGERPFAVYFSKRVNEAVADGEYIDGHFDIVDSLDYEVELAVIIGKDAKNVKKEDIFEYILGYTILNDISARNLQTQHKQWYFGKSLDGFTPMGPWIVTTDEFVNPPELKISSKVNGEIRQDSSTDLFIFDIAHVVNELSQGMTLKAGTIISMGTPAGVGMGFVPPKFLKSGDIIECEIEGIGSIKNIIK
ncbi:FAA hydrolase family protein [Peptacetobacter hominis]|uniref:FAA hydrolase family protein n=1 Tax=Peptacetobacter hominis TaxID=2743610 RepID=A0A544QVQ9_9FIRM|nr:fumarylacetoacetate hydrolase family protein [Peptacetobacter hominis]TQQ84778.1 FAA hydrolase family protein [Peptacetobacter hominis]